jgi:hypothetical protein
MVSYLNAGKGPRREERPQNCMFSFPPPVTLKWSSFEVEQGARRAGAGPSEHYAAPRMGPSANYPGSARHASRRCSPSRAQAGPGRRIQERKPYARLTFHFKYNRPPPAKGKTRGAADDSGHAPSAAGGLSGDRVGTAPGNRTQSTVELPYPSRVYLLNSHHHEAESVEAHQVRYNEAALSLLELSS